MRQETCGIKVRSRHHDFDAIVPASYDSDNAVLTAERNALQLIIPAGEAFFIRSVQRFASRARDPVLQAQIKAFIGQEANHSRETSRALEVLKREGFPVEAFQERFDAFIRRLEGLGLKKVCLAVTAAAEHYTAVFSLWNLGTRYADRLPPPLRDLSYWHGAEELEHRAVAFDLLQTVAPKNYFLRMFGFIVGMSVVWLWYRRAYRLILRSEGWRRARLREERRKARQIRIPVLSLGFPRLFAYLRPGFHPMDLNDGGIGEKILAEQEGPAGPGYAYQGGGPDPCSP